MNILITGTSRGIGAAALEALGTVGHQVVGHSTKGSDTLIAGDLGDPSSARSIWDAAVVGSSVSTSDRHIDRETVVVMKLNSFADAGR